MSARCLLGAGADPGLFNRGVCVIGGGGGGVKISEGFRIDPVNT